MPKNKYKKILVTLLVIGTLFVSGCGDNDNYDSDQNSLMGYMESTLVDENLPLNEEAELSEDVIVLDESDIADIEILDKENGQFEMSFKSARNLRSTDFKVGSILMEASGTAVETAMPWAYYPVKIVSKMGEVYVLQKVDNLCEAVHNGTLAYNPIRFGPYRQNSSIKTNHYQETLNFDFGSQFDSELEVDLIPSFAVQCKNGEILMMETGLAGNMTWINKLPTSISTPDLEIPIMPLTSINVGKAKIGFLIEYRPKLTISQNMLDFPTLTIKKDFAILNRYSNGEWNFQQPYVSNDAPTLEGVRLDPTEPKVGVDLDSKFFVGIGGNVLGKGLEAGFSASLYPSFSLKSSTTCWDLYFDLSAGMQLELDYLFASMNLTNDYFQQSLVAEKKLNSFLCEDPSEADNSSPDDTSSLTSLQGQAGDPRINLNWSGNEDLDLFVVDPCGNTIYFENKEATCDGHHGVLDVDANFEVFPSDPQENTTWSSGGANGQYSFYVMNQSENVNVDFVITLVNNGKTQTYSDSVSPNSESKIITFTH